MAGAEEAVLLPESVNTLMYFAGPFFCNPAKPAMQTAWCRTGYEVAYKHFKRDHSHYLNLQMHAVALVFQVISNFAFLDRLDELIGSPRWGWLSSSTALTWALLLLPQQGAPLKARAIALACIAIGYALRKKVAENWEKLLWLHGVLEVQALQTFFRTWHVRARAAPRTTAAQLLACRWGLQAFLQLAPWGASSAGKFKPRPVGTLAVPVLLSLSYNVFGRTGSISPYFTIYQWSYFGWIVSLLTKERVFFLHSCAFSMSLLQGIAHAWSKQLATLPQLRNAHHEFAHCSYFPVLVVHRVLEHLANRAAVMK